jgi:uncharacterized membrane protein YkoI
MAARANAEGKGDRRNPQQDTIPKLVMDALKARFPAAEIDKWSKEKEDDFVIYDFEFTQRGRKFEADIREDGTIHNWEQEVGANDLPEVVEDAVERRYPGSTPKTIMAITAVTDGEEALEGYEIVIETADGKEVEVTVAPDGKILEDSGAEH